MAVRNIYVKDENVELYLLAEKLSGKNLSALVGELIERYVLEKKLEGNYYAICYVGETEDGVPTFIPEYFVRTPIETDITKVKKYVSEQYKTGQRTGTLVYPLTNKRGELVDKLKITLNKQELDIVELT